MKAIKKMGLIIAALLAFGASIGATSASASALSAGEYPATASAATGEQNFMLTTAGFETGCYGMSISSTLTHPTLAAAFTAANGTCTLYGSEPMQMKGCGYTFHPGSYKSEETYGGTFDIAPSGCGPILIDSAWCDITIPSQSGLGAEYTNSGSGKTAIVKATLKAQGTLTYTQTGSGCGKPGTHSDGSYSGDFFIGGTSKGGQTGLTVNGELNAGLFLNGENKFAADGYPMTISGPQTKTVVTGKAFEMSCESVQFKSGAASATSSLAVEAAYDKCKIGSFPALVIMNSCNYVFNAAGTMDIACSKEGDAIEFNAYLNEAHTTLACRRKLAPQSGLKGITYENTGSGSGRKVAVHFNVEGLQVKSQEGPFCSAPTSLTYGGDATLTAEF